MARKMIMITAVAATLVTAMVPATAMAQDRYHGGDESYSSQDEHGGWSRNRNDEHRDWSDNQPYDRGHDRYAERGYRQDRNYQVDYRDNGRQGYYDRAGYSRNYYGRPTYRYRCEGSGTTGTIVGAIAGGLLGNGLAGHGDRTLGLILGGGAGALAGRAIDKSSSHC
jgi:Ni/Co efflux regulator RcnB